MSNFHAAISKIAYYLPETVLTNDELVDGSSKWTAEQIHEKLGIRTRHIASQSETASDLAAKAAENLFAENPDIDRKTIDLLVFCTQSPDYLLPTSACMLQNRLGLPTSCAAFDFNLGCSGYIYGLSIIKGMLETGQCHKALLLNGETYSKWMDASDISVRAIFGDAGTATLVEKSETGSIGPFVFGTDGEGAHHLIVHGHAARPLSHDPLLSKLPPHHQRDALFMDGPEIYSFTLESVPKSFRKLLSDSNLTINDMDLVVFHQANTFMLEQLRKYCMIPVNQFVIDLENYGNTVSCTIPIVLSNLLKNNQLHQGMRLALVGFGVGLSWGGCLVDWQ